MMKNFAKIFTAIVVAFAAYSCVADATEDLGVDINVVGQNSLTLSLDETRVQLGEKAEGVYPLYWSNGDQIAVNGVASAPLTDVAEDAKSATFQFDGNGVSAPFNIVYPAPEAVAAEEGEEEAPAAAAYPVVFPAVQQYVAGNIDPKAMVLYGYAANGEAVTLNPLVGVLRLEVTGNGEKVTLLTVKSEKGKIAGSYTVDCTNGTLTAVDASNTVTMNLDVTLGAEAQVLYVAVPAGSYGTFVVTLTTAEHGKMTVKFNSDVKPIEAGTVREFKPFPFAANNADEEGVFEIDSEDALFEFARIAKAFYPHTKAVVTEPITVTKDWTPIEGFGAYEFDGGEFEISGLNAPLFGSTAATIKNVKLVDVNYTVTDLAHSGAIACGLYGGSLENCSVSGTININNTTLETAAGSYAGICHAGLVGYASAATVNNCTNDADITITSLCEASKSIASTVGGVVGSCANYSSFTHLTNNGTIEYVGTTQKNNIYISGIVGTNNSTGDHDFAALSNCTNNGTISTAKTSTCGNTVLLSGITGNITTDSGVLCKSLVNTANITNNGQCTSCYIGGVVSFYVYNASLDQCSNSGQLTIGDDIEFNEKVYVSGVANRISNTDNTYKLPEITNCTNSGAISVGKCTNKMTGNDGRLFLGGVLGEVVGANLSKCYNESTGTITAKTGKWDSRYMIGGVMCYTGSTTPHHESWTITDCENKAAILVEPSGDINSMQLGGATSEPYVNKQNDTYQVKYLRVKNSGNITVKGTYTTGGYPYMGGFLGVNNFDNVVMEDCENSGDIEFAGTAASPRVGGLVGFDGNNNSFLIDGCTNKGNVTLNSVVTANVRLGGIIGICAPEYAHNVEIKGTTNEGCVSAIDQTVISNNKNLYCIGGMVGYAICDGLTLTNCTNGSSTDATKGAITVGNTPAGEGLAGMVGISDNVLTITGCKNYGTIKQDGYGGATLADLSTKASTAYRAHVAGILGKCMVGGINVTNCENHGVIEYCKPNPQNNSRVDIAGIVATTVSNDNVIKGCKNAGTINYKAVKTNAGEVTVAGIVGCPQSGTLIENCENTSTGLVHAAGATTSGYDVAGIGGGPSGTNVLFKGCKNFGEVKQSGATAGSMYIGGICGYGYSTKGFENCENRGPVTIENTSSKPIYAGGIVGWARIAADSGTTASTCYIKNCANYYNLNFAGKGSTYYAGGIAGTINDEDAERHWEEISGLKNVANITFSCTCTTPSFGGIVGYLQLKTPDAGQKGQSKENTTPYALANITDCVSYGDIKAIGKSGKVGMFTGVARSASFIFTDSSVGGNLIFAETTTTEEDPNGGEDITTTTPTYTPITESNWFEYIYKTAVTEEVATGDGCSWLSEKPAVPAAN